jgi:hypothetical protein
MIVMRKIQLRLAAESVPVPRVTGYELIGTLPRLPPNLPK